MINGAQALPTASRTPTASATLSAEIMDYLRTTGFLSSTARSSEVLTAGRLFSQLARGWRCPFSFRKDAWLCTIGTSIKVTITAPSSLLSPCTKDLSFDDECNLRGNER